MLINWFTVVAQIINFLILVWLLKRYLYKPVLNAIDEREKRIAAEMEDAQQKQADAVQEKEAYTQKNQALNTQRDALLQQATEDAKAEKLRLLEQARTDAESLRMKLAQQYADEQSQMGTLIRNNIRDEVFAISRKVVGDLSDESLDLSIARTFIQRIAKLNQDELAAFKAVYTTAGSITVKSAFDLPADYRQNLAQAIHSVLGVAPALQYEVSPAMVGGIELVVNGYKLSWNITEYLGAVAENIQALMDNFINKNKG